MAWLGDHYSQYLTSNSTTITRVTCRNSIKMFTIGFVTLVITTATSDARAKIFFPLEHQEDLLQRGGLSDEDGEISAAISFTSEEIWSEGTTVKDVDAIVTENIVNTITDAECPDDEEWCDAPSEYPEHAIHNAVTKQKQIFKEMFKPQQSTNVSDLNIEMEKVARHSDINVIGLRQDFVELTTEEPEEEFTNICDLKTRYITPRAAKNKEGKFRFIVNHPDGDEEYTQLVRVTQCSGAGEACGGGALDSAGVRTRCQQEYSDHKLVSLGDNGEELVVDTFSFPSCCTCLISNPWSL